MTEQLNLLKSSKGRLCDHVDGDNAVKEGQTVSCPKADSRNCTKPSGKSVSLSLADLTINEAQKQGPNEADSSEQGETTRGHTPVDDVVNEMECLNQKRKEVWNGIGKKQGIRIATLNVKGRTSETKSKWPMITTLIRKLRIAVMAIQESHLNNDEVEKIKKMCPKIEIISNSEHTTKEGVGFIINKDLTKGMEWNHQIIIKNRASRLTIKVEEERGIDIIVIYAPNEETEKKTFFEELKTKLEGINDIKNMVILGDFNSVENEIDRFPNRKDKQKTIEPWLDLKKKEKKANRWMERT